LTGLGEPVLEPGIPELIHRTDRSQDLTITSIFKKPQ
jgi:molybdenum cofactor biosynthesis enzyme MoaA